MFRLFPVLLTFVVCTTHISAQEVDLQTYFPKHARAVQSGGTKVVRIESLGKKFKIWTKRFGNNSRIKVLLLQGGPGCSHEYWECMESFLPREGIEFIYYDQLGTGRSDNPDDEKYWELDRYVDELEQVRMALELNKDNFFVLGHSWGGILAVEYALKYPDSLKGLVISNMMMSCTDYDRYADEVLAKKLDPAALKEIREIEAAEDFKNPRYFELLDLHFNPKYVCRIPFAEWPEPMVTSFDNTNQSLYVTMQGPSEFGVSGKLTKWDVKDRLGEISIPTLSIGATHDTMDPEHMKWISTRVKRGRFLLCPNGSHMCMWDDQEVYMSGLIQFLRDVDSGRFPAAQ